MLEALTLLLFLLVTVGTAWAGFRTGGWRARGVRRLSPLSAPIADPFPSPAMFWRELVSRLGAVMPASERDLPRLKRRLVRAGIRNPNGARYFQGIRLVTTLLFTAAALAGAWQGRAAPHNPPPTSRARAALPLPAPT